jgi:hypothetical protein
MKQKFKIASPNLADSVKMLWKVPNVIGINSAKRPPTISIVGSTYKDQKQRHGSYRRYGS